MKRTIDYAVIFIALCLVMAFVGCEKEPERPVLYQCPSGEIVEQPAFCPLPETEEKIELPEEPEKPEPKMVPEDEITPADSLKLITLDDYDIDPYPANDMIYLEGLTVTIRNYKKQAIKPKVVVVLGGTSPYQTRPISISKTFEYNEIPPGYKRTEIQELDRIKLEGNRDLKIIEVNLFDSITNKKLDSAKVQFIPEKII